VVEGSDGDEDISSDNDNTATTRMVLRKTMKIYQRHKIPTCNHYQKRMIRNTHRKT
jgi:hypothetical protein